MHSGRSTGDSVSRKREFEVSMHFVESLISPIRLLTRTKTRTGISSSECCTFSIFGFLIDLAVHSEISTARQASCQETAGTIAHPQRVESEGDHDGTTYQRGQLQGLLLLLQRPLQQIPGQRRHPLLCAPGPTSLTLPSSKLDLRTMFSAQCVRCNGHKYRVIRIPSVPADAQQQR